MSVQFNIPYLTLLDANGEPISGGTVQFYTAGTLTPTDVYSDSSLSTAIEQPIEADAAGRITCPFMDAGSYRVIIKDADGTTILDRDNYDPGLSSALGTSSALPISGGGTGATTAAAARSNLGVPSQSQLTSATNDISELQTQVATGLNADDEFGTAAAEDTGTSGNKIPLLDGDNTHSGANTFSNAAGIVAKNTVKAFAKFTVSGTTVTFTAANYFNIASVTRTGSGVYTIAFTTALPTANFVVVGAGVVTTTSPVDGIQSSESTTGFTLTIRNDDGLKDPDYFAFAVFGF